MSTQAPAPFRVQALAAASLAASLNVRQQVPQYPDNSALNEDDRVFLD